MLALLAVPGFLVAGITLLIDAYWKRWKRRHRDLAEDVAPFRLSEIADEAQRWLDAQT